MVYYMATRGAPHHRVPPFGRALHYLLNARASGEGHVLLPANALVCMLAQTLAPLLRLGRGLGSLPFRLGRDVSPFRVLTSRAAHGGGCMYTSRPMAGPGASCVPSGSHPLRGRGYSVGSSHYISPYCTIRESSGRVLRRSENRLLSIVSRGLLPLTDSCPLTFVRHASRAHCQAHVWCRHKHNLYYCLSSCQRSAHILLAARCTPAIWIHLLLLHSTRRTPPSLLIHPGMCRVCIRQWEILVLPGGNPRTEVHAWYRRKIQLLVFRTGFSTSPSRSPRSPLVSTSSSNHCLQQQQQQHI